MLLEKNPALKGGHGIKTIDDDLPVTDISPGVLTALLFNAVAITNTFADFSSYLVKGNIVTQDSGVVYDAYLNCPVMIYQTMGRKSGKLTQGTGIAKVDPRGQIDPDKAPHIIISKETPFDKDMFYNALEDVLRRQGKAVIVVQEDIDDAKTGKSLVDTYNAGKLPDDDPSGNVQHGRATSFSTGRYIAELVTKNFKMRSFYGTIKDALIIPQHLQRGAYAAIERDKEMAFKVGYRLAMELAEGNSGFSVILKKNEQGIDTDITALENIAGKAVQVGPDQIKDGYKGPTQDFVNHYINLMGGPGVIPHYSKPTMMGIQVPKSIQANRFAKPLKENTN